MRMGKDIGYFMDSAVNQSQKEYDFLIIYELKLKIMNEISVSISSYVKHEESIHE
jgi:hypothetical protein